jgi:predicted SAM-dependent methyltransferase
MRSSKKVNLGCGDDVKDGFCNIDLATSCDIQWDLRKGLPEELVDIEYFTSSHMLEHLEDAEALALLKDIYSKLIPGGCVRLCLPDFKLCAKHYLDDHEDFFLPVAGIYNIGMNRETATIIDYMEYCVRQFGDHVAVYDSRKARKFLEVAGFKDIRDDKHDSAKDGTNGLRMHFSFYIEAYK